MLNNQEVSKPMDLEMAYNVRDLGVYTNCRGEKLVQNQLYRADGLHSLTGQDQEKLKQAGIAAVIDLRSCQEVQMLPCVFCNAADVDYHQVPLLDQIQSNGLQGGFPESMAGLYIDLLEHSKEEIAKVLRIIAGYPNQAVVFNCTAGKDRTGVIAMLLLDLAEVEEKWIIADYAASEENIRPLFEKQMEQLLSAGIKMPEYLFASRPEEMEKTIQYLNKQYGSVRKYTESLNLDREEIGVIQRKMEGSRR